MATDDALAMRLPPHDRDAERSVLGSMLRDNQMIADVLQFLKADHFYSYAHQRMYEAISTLSLDRGVPVDPVTLAHYLNEQQLMQDIGGAGYIVDLWDAAPSTGNAVHYANIIRQKAIV